MSKPGCRALRDPSIVVEGRLFAMLRMTLCEKMVVGPGRVALAVLNLARADHADKARRTQKGECDGLLPSLCSARAPVDSTTDVHDPAIQKRAGLWA
jgi:uncharacterized protein YacL